MIEIIGDVGIAWLMAGMVEKLLCKRLAIGGTEFESFIKAGSASAFLRIAVLSMAVSATALAVAPVAKPMVNVSQMIDVAVTVPDATVVALLLIAVAVT